MLLNIDISGVYGHILMPHAVLNLRWIPYRIWYYSDKLQQLSVA